MFDPKEIASLALIRADEIKEERRRAKQKLIAITSLFGISTMIAIGKIIIGRKGERKNAEY